jgi:predicted nucleic acid-binding protein
LAGGVFVDTSFLLALLWPRDPEHRRAAAWRTHVLRHRPRLVTTEAVLWELLNALAAPATRGPAYDAYTRMHGDPQFEVVGSDARLSRSALDLYAARADKGWGVTDCLSFVVMRERSLSDALTKDRHFEQAGFAALLLRDPP